MTTPQHDDPFGEATGKTLQVLAVFTTIGESFARFAAAGAQSRAAKTERQNTLERAADAARHQADQASQRAYDTQRRADRRLMDLAFDDAWLNNADIETVANLWRTAAMYGLSGDRRAAEAMRRAQDRLAVLNPGLIDAYERHRAAGMPIADAMKAAAKEVWQHQTRTPTGRPHGNAGDPPPAILAAPKALGAAPDGNGQRLVDELDAATRAEIQRLAVDLDPDVLDQLSRQWRSTGRAPAANAADLLADAARQIRADGALGGPITAIATVRRGRNHSSEADPPTAATYDEVEAPIHSGSTTYELVAQRFEHLADELHAQRAEQAQLTGQADQQARRATVDQAQPDLLGTTADEHRDGLATGHARRGRAEQDQAASQQHRLGQAFPPLRSITPTFSHPPTPTTSQPAPRRRGGTR